MKTSGRKIAALGIVLAAVWGASWWALKQGAENRKKKLHAAIATIRVHEESHALRHGFYRLLPNSCAEGSSTAWKALEMPVPPAETGCFTVVSPDPSFADATSAPTMQIVGELKRDNLRGVEGNNDKAPTWSKIDDAVRH